MDKPTTINSCVEGTTTTFHSRHIPNAGKSVLLENKQTNT